MLKPPVKLTPAATLARTAQQSPTRDAQFAPREITEESNVRRAAIVIDVRGTTKVPVDRHLVYLRTEDVSYGAQQTPASGVVRMDRIGRETFLREEPVAGYSVVRYVGPRMCKERRGLACQPLYACHSGLGVAPRTKGEEAPSP